VVFSLIVGSLIIMVYAVRTNWHTEYLKRVEDIKVAYNTVSSLRKDVEDLKVERDKYLRDADTAKREADLIRKEAELQAARLLEQAHRQVGELQAQIADLKRQKQVFEARLRAALKLHLDLLEARGERLANPSAPPPAERDAPPEAGRS